MVVEPERYELTAPPAYQFEIDRRDFMKFFGAGVAVFLVCRDSLGAQESGRRGPRFNERLPQNIGAWLHVGETGEITVLTGKVEIGQNIRTSLTQAVAEELHVALSSIRMVMGDTQLTPFDMGTFGSRTTPTMNLQLRRVASVARDMLVQMAAKRWNADAAKLTAENGHVTNPANGRSVAYADLAKGQTLAQALLESDPLTPAAEWKVAGTPAAKINAVDFVTGRHQYPSDIRLDGMLYGKVLHPTAFGATLSSLDASRARAMPGVTVVHDGDFVGVAAPTMSEAEKALAALRADWKTTPQISNRELFGYLKKNASPGSGQDEKGSVENGLAAAAHRLEETYTIAYIAHTPLEPRAATAEWKDGKLTVWTGTQRPFGVRGELAEAFRLSEDDVHVLMPDMGSGYGGKHTGEAAIAAARLAKAANRPVKLNWTREEEFTWAYFRPAGVIEIKSGAAADGTLTAWEFHNYNSGGAGIGTPYEVANQRIEFHPVESPLRQGSYRGLAATANHFARESHMDGLAHAAKMDPLDFRLKNLKDERLKDVFKAAAEKFRWSSAPKAARRGIGIGGGFEKGGYVATCVEVAADRASGSVHIVRVVTAFDCGAVVNPNGLKNQIEGANIMGLGGALFEAIEFENGRILNPKLSQYRVPHFSDVPPIEVVLIDRKDQPSAGAGETPLVGLAPAIGNAIFDATGMRLRSLPMIPHGLKV
ncbi:MAG: molybdopterin cofactor-binding domain-containing protein [Deltaproteobacteria bacterium]